MIMYIQVHVYVHTGIYNALVSVCIMLTHTRDAEEEEEEEEEEVGG